MGGGCFEGARFVCILGGLMQRGCCWVLFGFDRGLRPRNMLWFCLRRWRRRVFLKRESPLQTDIHFLETRAEFIRERESSFRSIISAISKGKLDMKSTSQLSAPMERMSLAKDSMILPLAMTIAEWCSSVGSSVYIQLCTVWDDRTGQWESPVTVDRLDQSESCTIVQGGLIYKIFYFHFFINKYIDQVNTWIFMNKLPRSNSQIIHPRPKTIWFVQ